MESNFQNVLTNWSSVLYYFQMIQNDQDFKRINIYIALYLVLGIFYFLIYKTNKRLVIKLDQKPITLYNANTKPQIAYSKIAFNLDKKAQDITYEEQL